MKQTLQFLDYADTQEESVLTYNASTMKLAAHIDASVPAGGIWQRADELPDRVRRRRLAQPA